MLLHLRLGVGLLVIGGFGCATAGRDGNSPDGGIHVTDSSTGSGDHVDAAVQPPQMDAPSGGCTTMMRDLLANGKFDATPIGMGWTSTPIQAAYPIVTAQNGVTAQTAPNKAWMGGIAAANANDSIYQDIAVPASTTALVLTGYYDVRTQELGSAVYDRGTVELVQTSGTVIENVLSLDNAHAKTAWTAINHTFTAGVAGQTVRLRFTSASDDTFPTSFYFDSLALTATVCE